MKDLKVRIPAQRREEGEIRENIKNKKTKKNGMKSTRRERGRKKRKEDLRSTRLLY